MSRPTERIGEELPDPFAYPHEAHQRRHGPAGYTNYQSYKPWLRDEFAFRCVYCLFLQGFGYPDDLPDLTKLRPPGGNLRKGSESTGFHRRRSESTLPAYY